MKMPTIEEFFDEYMVGKAEGDKYSDDPDDGGGPTRFGITQETLDEARSRQWVADLPVSPRDLKLPQARAIFIIKYWKRMKCVELPGWMGLFAVDAAYVSGYAGLRTVQDVISVLSGIKLVLDGHIGPKTVAAASRVLIESFVEAFCVRRDQYYKAIVVRKPSQKKWLNGWKNRTKKLRDYYEKKRKEMAG